MVNTDDNDLILPNITKRKKCDLHLVYLSQVSDQVQGYLGKSIMEVATDHIDPVGAVAGIAVCTVQAHHVGQVGECG